MASAAPRDELAAEVARIVGAPHLYTDLDLLVSFTTDWTGRWRGPARFAVRPADTAEVAAVVSACAAARVPLIPQGGNTGLVGGGVPGGVPGGGVPGGVPGGGGPGDPETGRPGSSTSDAPVILSLTRLNGIGPVDTVARQVTAGAGVTLARLQAVAAESELAFGVDLTARDSATVGGMVATNAGGVHVLRFGPMRSQVVGVEAVLADGRVVSRLTGLEKDNVGYDLGGLLVGSEGTLGVVTQVRLRLVAHSRERVTALVGVDGTADALRILGHVRTPSLEAAEIFYADGLARVCQHAGLAAPLAGTHPAYLLLECAGATDPTQELAGALDEAGALTDTAVASDTAGRTSLWAYRERHSETVAALAAPEAPHKLDVSVPLARLAEFETAVRARVAEVAPDAIIVLWGHVGDGNLHVNVIGPRPEDDSVDDAVLRLAASLGGSISAEHGIGRAKMPWLPLARSPVELAAMGAIKRALDPLGLLNPGVLIADRTDANRR